MFAIPITRASRPVAVLLGCRRRSNIDQVYRLNFDQGR